MQQEQDARINAMYNQLGAKASKLHYPYTPQAYAAEAAQAYQAPHSAHTSYASSSTGGAHRPRLAAPGPQSAFAMSNWEIDAKDHTLNIRGGRQDLQKSVRNSLLNELQMQIWP